jgi:methionine biosynthesis protein MetW
MRIGKQVIIVFPNFAHWRVRLSILFHGITPVTDLMPYRWYDTPNLHFLSVLDFLEYSEATKVKILNTAFFHKDKRVFFQPNLMSSLALFVLKGTE